MVEIYTDGASIGNPGKIGIGYLIYKDARIIKEESVSLGIGTNNVAEYMACVFALTDALALGEKRCRVYSDSNLLCQQVKGAYKVKNKNIYPLHALLKKIISYFDDFSITYIEREKNKQADRLAKKATGFLV